VHLAQNKGQRRYSDVAYRIVLASLVMLWTAGCASAQVPVSVRPSVRVVPVATSAPCSPKPCALVDGLQISVSDLERSAVAPAGATDRPPQSHYVRLRLSFVAVSGDHTVWDPGAFMLIDQEGPDSMTSSAPGVSLSHQYAHRDNFCGATPPSTGSGGGNIGPPLAQLKPGQRFGPFQMCFWVRGSVNQRLTYAWWPFNAPDTPGVLYRPVEIAL
jgi:hypothetical protein